MYRTPRDAAEASPEKLAYVAAFSRPADQSDAIAVLDVDPGSVQYGSVVCFTELPHLGGAVQPLVMAGGNLSVDDQFLYVSYWGTGKVKKYNVSDPLHPVETGSVRIGGIAGRAAHPARPDQPLSGGLQMVEVSEDGTAFTSRTRCYGKWTVCSRLNLWAPKVPKGRQFRVDVIIAARLSRVLDQRLGGASKQTGIDTQDQDVTRWAEFNGHRIVAVIADRISGSVAPFDRKNLSPWLKEPKLMAQYQGIVFANMTRYGRARDWRWREWAEEHGKALILVSPELRWPPADPTDTITPQYWDMLINQSIAEWIARSKGYKRMQRTLRDNNMLVGRPNYGYRAVEYGDHKILVKDRIVAPLLKEAAMVHYVEEDWSLADCIEWLFEHGVASFVGQDRSGDGKPFTVNGLSSIFRNPALHGRRVHDNGTVELRIDDPILTREEWLKLQAVMDKRSTRKGIAPKATARLTAIIHCPRCEGPMYRLHSQRAGRGTAYYHCRGTKERYSTCRNAVPLEDVHSAVDDAIESVGHFPHTETIFIPGDSHASEIADIEERIRDLDLDAPDYMERLAELRAARKALKELPSDSGKSKKIRTGQTIKQFWYSQDDAGKRDYLLNELHWRVYASKDEDSELTVTFMGGNLWTDIEALGGPPTVKEVSAPTVTRYSASADSTLTTSGPRQNIAKRGNV